MEARLFVFVLDIYFSGTLVVKESLPEYEFEIILMHVRARTRYLIVSTICDVKSCSIAVA